MPDRFSVVAVHKQRSLFLPLSALVRSAATSARGVGPAMLRARMLAIDPVWPCHNAIVSRYHRVRPNLGRQPANERIEPVRKNPGTFATHRADQLQMHDLLRRIG